MNRGVIDVHFYTLSWWLTKMHLNVLTLYLNVWQLSQLLFLFKCVNGQRAWFIDKTLGAPVSQESLSRLGENISSAALWLSHQNDFSKGQRSPWSLGLPAESTAGVINSGKVLMSPYRDFFLTLLKSWNSFYSLEINLKVSFSSLPRCLRQLSSSVF
jgi:hypothetical protein